MTATPIKPVKDHARLFRDTQNNAVFSTDDTALKEYKARKRRAQEFEEMKSRQVDMEENIREIKELVYKVLEKYDHR